MFFDKNQDDFVELVNNQLLIIFFLFVPRGTVLLVLYVFIFKCSKWISLIYFRRIRCLLCLNIIVSEQISAINGE